ncbi:MAG: lipoyl(octanoyl) transferase LipB [Candidatus Omnitrophota bacterium]
MDCKIIGLGIVDVKEAFTLQKYLHSEVCLNKSSNSLILLEHFPVITLGRNASKGNILVSEDYLKRKGINIIDIDRGGDVTMHMPGQLVAYPIFNLNECGKDVHLFVRNLEEVIIRFLGTCNIKGMRVKGLPGVWVGGKKIGFIGIGISKWISFHGISINIDCELELFSLINPCGIQKQQVTSVSAILGRGVSVSQAKIQLAESFEDVFCLKLGWINSDLQKKKDNVRMENRVNN